MKRVLAILISIMMLFAFAPLSASAVVDVVDEETTVENSDENLPAEPLDPDTEQGANVKDAPASGNEGGTTAAPDDGVTVAPSVEATTAPPATTTTAPPKTTTAAATTTTSTANSTLPAVGISSVTAGKGKLTVKWGKVSAANLKKIQIQYGTNKTFKTHVYSTTTAATNTSKTIKKLTNGTYYYVRVRVCAKTNGKTRYSKWSAVKTVKTKGTNPSLKQLSSTYVKVVRGGTKKIKLKKGKGKWSLGGSGVIKFGKKTSTYVTVKPLKAGIETVYCKVGSRTYICTVKVLNNYIGNPREEFDYALVVGQKEYWKYDLPDGMTYLSSSYDKSKGKVTVSATSKSVKVTVKALKPGRFTVKNEMKYKGKKTSWTIHFTFINGFRGSANVKKTSANYAKWRKKTITSMVSSGMTSWEIVDAIGKLISSGKYSSKGGATGMQLWYGGNGTCVSGAKMMHDFMNDLGIKSKVHFAGKDKGPKDIYGNYMQYNKGHKNIYITMGGKTYEVNPQPGVPWPLGTVAR